MKRFFVYMLASRKNGTLYTGVTSDLPKRTHQHRSGDVDGFTSRYNVKRLVYCEEHNTAEAAIQREKNIKKWPRKWKVGLVEKDNPQWFDLHRHLNR